MVPPIHKLIYRLLTNNWRKPYVLPVKYKKLKLPLRLVIPFNCPYPHPTKLKKPYNWVLTMNWPVLINPNRLAMIYNWAILNHQPLMNWLWILMKILPIWMIEIKGIFLKLRFFENITRNTFQLALKEYKQHFSKFW